MFLLSTMSATTPPRAGRRLDTRGRCAALASAGGAGSSAGRQ